MDHHPATPADKPDADEDDIRRDDPSVAADPITHAHDGHDLLDPSFTTTDGFRPGRSRGSSQLPTPSLSPSPRCVSPARRSSDGHQDVGSARGDGQHGGALGADGTEDRARIGGLKMRTDDIDAATESEVNGDGDALRNSSMVDGRMSQVADRAVSGPQASDSSLASAPSPPSNSRRPSNSKAPAEEKVFKLTPSEIEELTASPDSLPQITPRIDQVIAIKDDDIKQDMDAPHQGRPPNRTRSSASSRDPLPPSDRLGRSISRKALTPNMQSTGNALRIRGVDMSPMSHVDSPPVVYKRPSAPRTMTSQPSSSGRAVASYARSSSYQSVSPHRKAGGSASLRLEPTEFEPMSRKTSANEASYRKTPANSLGDTPVPEVPTSPLLQEIPLPPMSIPTYLQLEVADGRPSPLYIYRPASADRIYESTRIKFERLLNFLLLPPQLEQVLCFGALACLDAWLYTFTILPLRFAKAAVVLLTWWAQILHREAHFLSQYVYHGSQRMWDRRRESIIASSRRGSLQGRMSVSRGKMNGSASALVKEVATAPEEPKSESSKKVEKPVPKISGKEQHRRRSRPSTLTSDNKADLLQGLVILVSCMLLMRLDASRMYHNIKAQSNIKLYVIYNGLEVCDKLLSALGQDIFECMFSNEVLDRAQDGRSKILRPFGMFVLASLYNVIHATALFYQVITLNVAVNSYSNALLTLLLSNQFVEIKSTVFKRIEKENLFQMTCADIIERFQLCLMLLIIGLRNIVEVGGLSITNHHGAETVTSAAEAAFKDDTIPLTSVLPSSFAFLHGWSAEVLSPFLIVLGSEMLVDSVKHAYVSKFNNVQPIIYQRYLDVLAKDYYTNAFTSANLIKRLGLPTIPLSCLFIRATLQTYHMFLATHFSTPMPSPSTSLSDPSNSASATTTAALERFDNIIRRALGGDAFGADLGTGHGLLSPVRSPWWRWTSDDAISWLTWLVIFGGIWLVLLVAKLVLGMLLLTFARMRYQRVISREQREREEKKERERERERDRTQSVYVQGSRHHHHSEYQDKARDKDKATEDVVRNVFDTGGRRIGGWGTVELDDDKRRMIAGGAADSDLRKPAGREKEGGAGKARGGGGGDVDFERIRRYDMVGKRIW